VPTSDLSLEAHGAQFLRALAKPMLGQLAAIAARLPEGRPGTRISSDGATAELLDPNELIGGAIGILAGDRKRPVRAVLFDKSDRANWSLGWHQDRTIAVRHRHEIPGFGPWTVKQGIAHVEPPFVIIERMITVRIHLDSVDADNAPLMVALGSHRLGRIAEYRLAPLVASCVIGTCLAEPGDVWVYATPIVHASNAAAPGRNRRVLQVDFSSDGLPDGLDWLGV